MTDFMNNVKSGKSNNFSTNSAAFVPNSDTNLLNKNLNSQKSDVVDLSKNKTDNKNKKKKIITYSAIAIGIGLAILAFFKRKQIGDFFSNLFKKKPKNQPTQPNTPRPPSGSDVPPPSGSGGGTTPPTSSTILRQNTTAKMLKLLESDSFEEIPRELDKLSLEEIPVFVQDTAKTSKKAQNNLLKLLDNLDVKHKKLIESDPQTIFKQQNSSRLYDEIKMRPENISCNDPTEIKKLADVEMQKLLESKGLQDIQPETRVLGQKLSVMRKAMIEGNISFIPKAPETFASEADKIEYIQMALRKANINEASAMDAMAVFEKYGSRYEYGTYKALNTNNGVSDLALAVEQVADALDAKTADKVMNKYIDLFNKYARIDGDYTDARRLTRLIERNHDKMSEETVIKFIESLKQFSFERAQTWSIRKYIVENEFTKRSPEELKRIDIKLKELEEIVKDMPMKNKLKPNG